MPKFYQHFMIRQHQENSTQPDTFSNILEIKSHLDACILKYVIAICMTHRNLDLTEILILDNDDMGSYRLLVLSLSEKCLI